MSTTKQQSSSGKLWGGRFTGKTDPEFDKFNASLPYDKIMYKQDIIGSIAYSKALYKANVINENEQQELEKGLNNVLEEWNNNKFVINESIDEDIHTANERRLTELIGSDIAGKLHTGRSRNDQVNTDTRLWLREHSYILKQSLLTLINTINERASNDIDIIMPGYTHLQPAQPIRWSHYLLSYSASFMRDTDRLNDCIKRINVCPLGSGALAGHPFNIDRQYIQQLLQFNDITYNSIDAVSDRDYIVEFMFVISLLSTHISQISEDFILYSHNKFITLADAYSTGSSLMPQKKNPDSMELLRGKTGLFNGALIQLLTTLKGLPRAYNKDLQEDKETLFNIYKQITQCIRILNNVILTLTVNNDIMYNQLENNVNMLATDLADYLVRKGVPFRQTHHIAGQAVQLTEKHNCTLRQLTLQQYKSLHTLFENDIFDNLDWNQSVENRKAIGGTAKSAVQQQIDHIKQWLNNNQFIQQQ